MKKQVSGRFFVKKLRKKLLLLRAFDPECRHARESGHPRLIGSGRSQHRAKRSKSFLVTFFQKSNCLAYL
jgi:hypothetical protein